MPELGKNFKKTVVRFEICTLKFLYLQNVTKKQKCLNLGPKMSDFGIFGLEFESNILIFEMTTLVIAKFRKKQKCLNFGSKILEDFCHVG